MKILVFALLGLVVPSYADDPTLADLVKAAADFGITELGKVEGTDHKGRRCYVYLSLDERSLGLSGTVFVTENGVEDANFTAYVNGDERVLELKVEGNSFDGNFKAKIREHVEAHKTDFGMWIAPYDEDYSLKLSYVKGKLDSASVKDGRPFPSNLVFDPDYRGGEVKRCTFR